MNKELEPYQRIERSLQTKFRKTIWNPFIAAVKRYELIAAGDKIAVCISGGKDSMLMAKLMQMLQRHSEVPFDLVFLDIFMDEITGMDVAHKLLEAGCDCTIIFLTSSREYALEGYEVGAFRYLLKPLTYDKLEDTLNSFFRKFRVEARKLPLMVERTPLYIPYSDLYYLSSVMRQTEVHLEKKVLKQSSAINFQKTVAPLLSDSRFFLCSKGVIVNLQHVSELEKDHFVLNNGEEVPISRRNLSQAKKTFLDFLLNQ